MAIDSCLKRVRWLPTTSSSIKPGQRVDFRLSS